MRELKVGVIEYKAVTIKEVEIKRPWSVKSMI
jgi:hypothetical protein